MLYSENGNSWVNSTLLEVVQQPGKSEDKVMSQKAVSDKLSDLKTVLSSSERKNTIQSTRRKTRFILSMRRNRDD